MRRGLAPLSDRRCLRVMEGHLLRIRPHIVHCHSAKAGFLGRLAARRAGVPGVVYTPHGFAFAMQVAPPLRLLYRCIERRLARCTSRIIAVCESEREVALRARIARPDQVAVIPNGIEFRDPPHVDRPAKLASLSLPPDAQLILCVGDFRPQKGYDVALRAMQRVVAEAPHAHLLIAGTLESEPHIHRLVDINLARAGLRGSVHFLGPRDDVPELLECCDVFCMPSLWEGCPYSLIEAAGAGCAIVASDIPGINDIVHGGESGWLVPAGNIKALAAGLIAALRDPGERLRRGAAAAWYVREHHRLERMVELTAGLYEEVAGSAC
jgi:glycosyltransferase involved in cell wall biosynthesis